MFILKRTPVFHLPTSALLDEIIHLELHQINPHHIVTIRAQMIDRVGQVWESWARFEADSRGSISTSTQAPISGTYSGGDPMGLFWSMVPIAIRDADPQKGPLSPQPVSFVAEDKEGTVIATSTLTRLFTTPDVTRIDVRENGLDGAWFVPTGEGPFPAVIVLGGSEGGLNVRNAALLAAHGFAALALAYFGRGNLPKYLVNIPLEYIKTAIDWVKLQTNILPNKLAIMGTSKGGELALLSAATFPEITAVVAYVPSGFVFHGLGPAEPGIAPSSWMYQGQPLPYANAEVQAVISNQLSEASQKGEPLAYRDWYFAKLGDESERTPYTIPVERINGPILLLTAADDQLWPSDLFGELVLERLRANEHPHQCEHICYPNAGHVLNVQGMPTTQAHLSRYGTMTLLLGGTPQKTAHAQQDAWKRTLNFLRETK